MSSKYSILVVDDEPKVAFFFQQHLERVEDGFVARSVTSGEEALAALRESAYDLLITDLRMPGMDGLELVRQVRQVSPQTKTILVTAYGSEDVWAEADRLRVFRSLSKPLKIDQLLSAVRAALRKQQPSGEGGFLVLSDTHIERLSQRMEMLRGDIGCRATILADTSGRALAYAGTSSDLDLSATLALLGGNMGTAGELLEQLQFENKRHLAYFEGPPFDLYAASLDSNFYLTIIYDRKEAASRIGYVWLYMRRALEDLRNLLREAADDPGENRLDEDFAQSLQGELDSLFGDNGKGAEATPLSPVPSNRATPPVGSPPRRSTFRQRLADIIERFSRQTGIANEQHLSCLEEPPPEKYQALLIRAVSASLKNVYRHAEATIIGVSFRREGDTLYGSVADNGNGFDMAHPPALHTLAELQAVFREQGGDLTIHAYPGQGATVEFEIGSGR